MIQSNKKILRNRHDIMQLEADAVEHNMKINLEFLAQFTRLNDLFERFVTAYEASNPSGPGKEVKPT